MRIYEFYFYITTNPTKTVLYAGATNSLPQRLTEHFFRKDTFAGKFHCYNLVYFEFYEYVTDAFSREKTIKGWSRARKECLIATTNPDWRFLNPDIMPWPPPVNSELRG
jgi:putative endonuclease